MMTKDEARHAVEAELRSRKLTKPMTLEQLNELSTLADIRALMRHLPADHRGRST